MSAEIIELLNKQANMDDLLWLAENMRDADKTEIRLSHNQQPMQALMSGLEDSTMCWMAKLEGRPIALFGVAAQNLIGSVGSPWLLGTDELGKVKKQFLKETRSHVDLMQQRYRVLMNFVHAEHEDSIRWLKWLGFTIMEPIPAGPYGAPFSRFERIADV